MSPMLDFAPWTQRVSTFLRRLTRLPGRIVISDSIEPPGDSDFDREWLESDECDLPEEIRRFVATASSRCAFFYEWTPPGEIPSAIRELLGDRLTLRGGGDLCELAKYYISSTRAVGSDNPLFGSRQDSVALEKSQGRVPLMEFRSGAVISLGPPGGDRRAVVYVEKIGHTVSRLLSESFEQFLLDWETTCYFDPDMDALAPWIDPSTGRLKPGPEESRALRQFLLQE